MGQIPRLYDFVIPGEEVSMDRASEVTGFRVRIPSYLPNDRSLQSVKMAPYGGGKLVYLLFSTQLVKGQVRLYSFLNDGGVIILQVQDFTSNPEVVVNDMIKAAPSLQKVYVKGYVGVLGGNIKHELQFWAEGVHYDIIVGTSMPLDELPKIANSLFQ